MDLLIVSGLSGAGKSQVARILEDMGHYCVDNMPVELIPPFVEICMASQGRYSRVALVIDVRNGLNFDALFDALARVRAINCNIRILFVEARPDTLVRRFKETRRRHPLDEQGLETAVALEQELLTPVRAQADYIVDTSAMSVGELRLHLHKLFSGKDAVPLLVTIYSFGFKYGVPQEADLMFDVRFLPNPFHIAELRPLSGLDAAVREYVLRFPMTTELLDKLQDLLDFLLPQYIAEGKTGLVVAIGCTGGRHRSVVVARELYDRLTRMGAHVLIGHRDVNRG